MNHHEIKVATDTIKSNQQLQMSSFGRRTWDRKEYAELAKQGQQTYEQSLRSSLTDVQLQQLKDKYTDHHALMQGTMSGLNQNTLVTGVSSYKKGKQFGFYCELCNMTFKDNLQYIDHLNHKTHEVKFEAVFDEPLVNDTRDNDDLRTEEFESFYIETVKHFVNDHQPKEKRVHKPRGKRPKTTPSQDSSDISKMMGFGSFGGVKR